MYRVGFRRYGLDKGGLLCRRLSGCSRRRGTAASVLQRRFYCSIRPVAVPASPSPREESLAGGFSPQSSSALAEKPLREIVRSWMVFKLLSYDWIVRNSLSVGIH